MAQKWPADWTPVEFIVHADSSVHHGSLMWGYMVGKYNYCTSRCGPDALKQFNQQFARRYLNHPGLAGYYFENEHFGDYYYWHERKNKGNRKRFADFLAGKYGSIAKLNESWGAACATLPDSRPAAQPGAGAADGPGRLRPLPQRLAGSLRPGLPVRRRPPQGPPPADRHLQQRLLRLRHRGDYIADHGGMVANGGAYANLGSLLFRETYAGIPGLMERMEPHGMWEYQPIPFGYDEMIFGMLIGRHRLNFHFFLSHSSPFNYDQYKEPNYHFPYAGPDRPPRGLRPHPQVHARAEGTPPGRKNLRLRGHARRRVLHRGLRHALSRGPLATGRPAHRPPGTHYAPKICYPHGDLSRLDDCKVVFLVNDVVTAQEVQFLKNYLAKGGHLVVRGDGGRFGLDDAENPAENYLLSQLGIDPSADGNSLAGVGQSHDIYTVGKGRLLLLFHYGVHPTLMEKAIPAIMAWAGVTEQLSGAQDDPDMLQFVLQAGDTYYFVTDHSVGHHDHYQENNWQGKVRFCKPLPEGSFEVTDIWNGVAVGTLTPAQLAAGFDAGLYHNKQMKIFRIRPAPSPR